MRCGAGPGRGVGLAQFGVGAGSEMSTERRDDAAMLTKGRFGACLRCSQVLSDLPSGGQFMTFLLVDEIQRSKVNYPLSIKICYNTHGFQLKGGKKMNTEELKSKVTSLTDKIPFKGPQLKSFCFALPMFLFCHFCWLARFSSLFILPLILMCAIWAWRESLVTLIANRFQLKVQPNLLVFAGLLLFYPILVS